jgi:molybdenum cofactor cytidylyltransferase
VKLHQAFRIVRGDVVAFIGAGGKTSALVTLGHELAELGWRVLATTTTHIRPEELDLMPNTVSVSASSPEISRHLQEKGFVFLYDKIGDERVSGIQPDAVADLLDQVDSDVLLIEADHASGRLLKAPRPDEPVIPAETSLVVPVASLGILGTPLNEGAVYNAQAIQQKYGFGENNRIKSPWVAQVLRDRDLMMRGIPDDVRVIGLLNQVPDSGYLLGRARLIAQLSLRVRDDVRGPELRQYRRLNGLALGSIRGADPVREVLRPIGAVVLAAGLASRMGTMKVLLPWEHGRTIIEHIVRQLTLARVDTDIITVVTGHQSKKVTQKLEGTGVTTTHNPHFVGGEMLSSLKTGLEAMPQHVEAALVVLGDQPRLQAKTVQMVMAAYARGEGDIIAPSYNMRRGHPILIDRKYWREILDLPEEGSPRDVINRHKDDIVYVTVDTDSVLKDVDTPEAYAEERRRAGLD